MNDSTDSESVRRELVALTASDDLMNLARHLRELGVESLLFARPDGRIDRVVTDRQIAHLATRQPPIDVVPTQQRGDVGPAPTPVPVQATGPTWPSRSSEGEGVRSQAG